MISPLSTTSSTEEKRKQNMNRDMHINKLNVRLQVQIRTEDFFKYSYRKTLFNAKTFHFSLTILPPTKPPLTPVSPHCLPPDPSPCSILHLPITFGSVHISVYMFLIPLPPSPPSLSPRNSLLLLAVGFYFRVSLKKKKIHLQFSACLPIPQPYPSVSHTKFFNQGQMGHVETIADMFLLLWNCSFSSRMAREEMKDKDTLGKMDQNLVIRVKMAVGEKADGLRIYDP